MRMSVVETNGNPSGDAVLIEGTAEPTPVTTPTTKTSQEQVSASAEAKVKPKSDFEPIVLAFSCNWCSYTSADLAGVNRFFYPANVRVIRFMCSGRIEPEFIMEAFEYGAKQFTFLSGEDPGIENGFSIPALFACPRMLFP